MGQLTRTFTTLSIAAALIAACGDRPTAPATNSPPPVPEGAFPVEITVDASASMGPVHEIWRYFGADEPNYIYGKTGEKLIGELGELRPGEVYFRAHNLLTTGEETSSLKWGSTNIYTEDENGEPVYDFTVTDKIFDTLLANGVKPLVELGFMPEALSTKPTPYRHSWGEPDGEFATGWAYPPNDYNKWSELIYQLVAHSVDRYGKDEVETWLFQTWNEPNIVYWQGTDEEFLKMNDYALAGVFRALPTARVGGPHTAGDGGDVARGFYEHMLRGENYATGEVGGQLDYLSFHAKGSPNHDNGYVQMGIANQLKTINDGFAIINEFPELAGKPVIIGESDPEGCAACQGEELQYRNGAMYASYTAASFARKHDLADRHNINLEGALTWAFTFEDQPLFAGFRSLASGGIDKPVLNTFRMFSMMTGDRIDTTSNGSISLDTMMTDGVRGEPDVSGFSTRDENTISTMVWHYHDDMVEGPDAFVELTFNELPPGVETASLHHFRIDDYHSNAYTTWLRMGSPQSPTEQQMADLQKASTLEQLDRPVPVNVSDGKATTYFALPRRGVSLLQLEWE